MKKTILGILMLLVMATGISALGAGIINNMDFGEVRRGESYTRELKIWATDQRYEPYTEIPVPVDNEVLIKIDYTDPYAYTLNELLWHANEYTSIPVTLKIPLRAKKGEYNSRICGKVCSNTSGIGLCVGACADLKYEIKPGSRRSRFKKVIERRIRRWNRRRR